MRVKSLAQAHSAVPQPGLKPRLLDPEYGALTIRPPHLPSCATVTNNDEKGANIAKCREFCIDCQRIKTTKSGEETNKEI